MKSENLLKPKSSLDYVISSHSTLLENGSIHPAFKITDNIYIQEKSLFLDQLSRKDSPEKSQIKNIPKSITPVPVRYYKDPFVKSNDREDIFLNPSAMYLSKKPIAFNKSIRENQRKKNQSLYIPVKEVKQNFHRKNKSIETNSKIIKLPKMSPPNLVPLDEIKVFSPRSDMNQSIQAKEKHCEALSMIADYCDNFKTIPSPSLNKEKKIVMKYSEKMKWVSEILHSYGEYDSKILKELYSYSNDSRNQLETERANIVNLIKSGVFDPNKNIIKLRARIKKKKERINA